MFSFYTISTIEAFFSFPQQFFFFFFSSLCTMFTSPLDELLYQVINVAAEARARWQVGALKTETRKWCVNFQKHRKKKSQAFKSVVQKGRNWRRRFLSDIITLIRLHSLSLYLSLQHAASKQALFQKQSRLQGEDIKVSVVEADADLLGSARWLVEVIPSHLLMGILAAITPDPSPGGACLCWLRSARCDRLGCRGWGLKEERNYLQVHPMLGKSTTFYCLILALHIFLKVCDWNTYN